MEFDEKKIDSMNYKDLCEYAILIGESISDLNVLKAKVERELVRRENSKEGKT